MIIRKCPECGFDILYLSEIQLIGNTDPQEVGLDGACESCGHEIYYKFKLYKIEHTYYDEYGNPREVQVVDI